MDGVPFLRVIAFMIIIDPMHNIVTQAQFYDYQQTFFYE
jgi:hypothetical protein